MCGKSRASHSTQRVRATQALQVAASSLNQQNGNGNAGGKYNTATEDDLSLVIDAVENFLRGAEWKQVMNTFINGHCAMFAVIDGEHGLGQHDVFRDFRDTVDGLLDGVLSSLGSSPELFITALKQREQRPERGPRDSAVNTMIRTLMTFERFDIFKVMMHEQNKKLEQAELLEEYPNSQHEGGSGSNNR
jgi:hypothetical protein